MHDIGTLERAKSYLATQMKRTSAFPHGKASRSGPFVTISRETGAGSSAFAAALVVRLNAARSPDEPPWTLFDRNLVETLLNDLELSPQLARFLPEAAVSEIDSSVGEISGIHPNLWQLTRRTNDMMRELARRGHAIIVGRGGNFVTQALSGGCHVRLVAPREVRVARMQALLKVNESTAATHVRRTDQARADYVSSVFDANLTEPSAYDLILNTARITPTAGARLVAEVLATAEVAG